MGRWLDEFSTEDEFFTDAPPEIQAAYYHALGRLMHSYARLEDACNALVADLLALHIPGPNPNENDPRKQAGDYLMRENLIRATLGSQRAGNLKALLKRILRLTEAPDSVTLEVDRIFHQWGEIGFVRDRLAPQRRWRGYLREGMVLHNQPKHSLRVVWHDLLHTVHA